MSLLGIDVGTTGCKAAIFSEDGSMLALTYEEYDYQCPHPGWAELDSRLIWQAVKRTIGKALLDVNHDPVKALSVSSLGESVVPVSAKCEILADSLLSFDVRGEEYLDELQKVISNEFIYQINGNTLGNRFTLTKLKWLKQYQPDIYAKTHYFLSWSGLVSFMLGAEATVDYSLGDRTLLFDLEKQDWSEELLELSGLDRKKFPAAVPSGRVIGSVNVGIADELGLPAGIPIVSGGHDQCCNALGCGVLSPGQSFYGMGTYLCMTPVFTQRPASSLMIERGLNTEHHVVPGQYVSFLYNQGGALVKWFRNSFASVERQLAQLEGVDLYTKLLAEMPQGMSNIMALPHFTATGPPEFISDSSGVLAGLTLETSHGEILKGLIEGMTFYVRAVFETLPAVGIEVANCHVAGGGSKSDAWVQVSADILERPFMRPRISEAGTLGAAILAGVASGIFPDLETSVTSMVHPESTFEPDPKMAALYTERFSKFQQLWPLMADYLRNLRK